MTYAQTTGHRGATTAVLVVGGGERQRRLDLAATAYAGLAMGAAAIIGAMVSAARHHGDIGPYGVICVVGGVGYVVSLCVLKRRS